MEKNISIYGYIIPFDGGFSPCYADGEYTLACCKPKIRMNIFNEGLSRNTWLIGMKHVGKNNSDFITKIIYVAHITNIILLEEYYDSGKYNHRCDCIYRNVKSQPKASFLSYEEIILLNPNIYHITESKAHWIDLRNPTKAQKDQLRKDIYGNCVLYSNDFYYLGDLDNFNGDSSKLVTALKSKCNLKKPGDYFKVERIKYNGGNYAISFDINDFYSFIEGIKQYKNRIPNKPHDFRANSSYTGLIGTKGCSND